jgi:hypothetical protein
VTLTIDRLVTRGKIPRNLKVDTAFFERVARERFPVECAGQLRRPWPVQPHVARIRRLRVRVTIPAAQLTADALAAAWTAAFIRELFAALGHPNGAEIVRFESKAEYLASAIRDLLTGVASQRWVYEEFDRSFNLGTAGAAFALFDRESSEIVPALLILENWGLLDRLLAVWDAATLERLFLAIESTNGVQDEKLSVEDLIIVARLLLGRRSLLSGTDSSRSANLGERKLALKLFFGLARAADWRNARTPSPWRIFRALRVLDTLLDLYQSVAAARRQLQLAAHTLHDAAGHSADSLVSAPADGIQTSRPAFRELLEKLGSVTSSETRQNLLNASWNLFAAANGPSRTAFADLLDELTSIVSSDTQRHQLTQFWNIIGPGSSARGSAFSELLGELISLFSSDVHRHQITELWNIIAAGSSESRTAFAQVLGELTSVFSSDTQQHQITPFWEIIVAGSSERRTAFAALFEELVSATDSGNRQGQVTKFKWISTECAGLFLLINVAERLGWADRLDRLSFGAANGPRLLTYTLAGIGLAILGRFEEAPASLDPGLALFSGWVDAPELGGLRRFFASEPAQTRRDLLVELLGDEVSEEGSIHWKACFDALANHLIREFAGRIRGFGRSSRQFVVKNFLALPGRIRVEETRLLIVFTSGPLNAVVHMSRLDDPVEEVSWLGRRRIEFEPYSI